MKVRTLDIRIRLMDKLTFITEIVKALAWPVSAGLMAYMFRKPLIKLFRDLHEFKGFGTEMKFQRRKLEIAAVAITNDLTSAPQKEQHDLQWYRQRLREEIQRLPKMDKVIVIFYYFEEMTVEEIAATLDLAPAEVEARRIAILQRLKRKAERQVPAAD